MFSIISEMLSMMSKRDIRKMYSSASKETIYDICDIDGAFSEKAIKNPKNDILVNSMIMKDGGLSTLIKINGVSSVMGDDELSEAISYITESLKGVLHKSGHVLTFYFTRDKELVHRDIDGCFDVLEKRNKIMELRTEQLMREQRELFSRRCAHESCYLALQTSPSSISSKAGVKRGQKKRDDVIKKSGLSSFKYSVYGQNTLSLVSELIGSHASFVNQVTSTFKDKHIDCSILTARRAVHTIREFIDPERTTKNWNPMLIGDEYSPRMNDMFGHGDFSHLSTPSIAEQILTRDYSDAGAGEATITKLGKKYYSCVYVARPPAPFYVFSDLFSAIPKETPWRMSYSIETGSDVFLSKIRSKGRAASFLAFSSSINEVIRDSVGELVEYAEKYSGTLVKGNIAFSTWGNSIEEVQTNASNIVVATESWGAPEVIDEKGDVPLGVLETVPCVTNKKVSSPFIFKLEDFVSSSPFTRPTSIWENGAFVAVTEDDKLWTYTSASEKQSTWVELVSARPGSGKSLTLNALNMSLFSSVEQGKIPRIAIIDIGPSSRYFVDYLRAIFPEKYKRYFKSYKLKNTKEQTINVFDTPLGCRKPVSMDKAFLINFLTTLLNDSGTKTVPAGLTSLSAILVDEMYNDCIRTPAQYRSGIDRVIDEAIAEASRKTNKYKLPENKTTFWEVTDYLALCGDIENAKRAQRYAVPTLSKASAILKSSDNIKVMYSDSDGLALVGKCLRAINSAMAMYPNLSSITNFDITTEDRIVSLDLSEVTSGEQQTCIMYMLARHLLCKDFYKDGDTVKEIKESQRIMSDMSSNVEANEFYIKYHSIQFASIYSDIKKIVYDEFHMTNGNPSLTDQVIKDMRVGRKYNIVICLSSQEDTDFTKEMVNMATTTFLMSKSNDDSQKDRFNLSDDAFEYTKKLNGATKNGAPAIVICKTKEGTFSQFIIIPLPSILVWAWSTTKQDVQLREVASKRCNDYVKVIDLLSQELPYGCQKIINERIRMSGAKISDDEIPASIYEEFFDERLKHVFLGVESNFNSRKNKKEYV